jgi:DNA polymerase-3 subunit alpha
LIEELGQDKVMGVGTYTTVGLASGIKDILRKCDVPFKESNDFCKELNNEISFEENMEYYKNNFPDLYKTYERYQAYLDFTPKIMNGVKNCGQHAGGVLILDKPVWNYIPVIHTKDGVASAFVENGSNTELDEMNLTKLDCLSISVLEVISNAIDSIDEELILIEDEDGVVKIVGSSYLKNKETEV